MSLGHDDAAAAEEPEARDDDWRCECGDLNRGHEAFCYRCGAGQPLDEEDRSPADP